MRRKGTHNIRCRVASTTNRALWSPTGEVTIPRARWIPLMMRWYPPRRCHNWPRWYSKAADTSSLRSLLEGQSAWERALAHEAVLQYQSWSQETDDQCLSYPVLASPSRAAGRKSGTYDVPDLRPGF